MSDFFTARIAHILTNVHRDQETHPEAVPLEEVMIFRFESQQQEMQDWRAFKEAMHDWVEVRKARFAVGG